jgi:glycine/D-amino acid oxidase-like deaminating enzyme
MSKIVSIKQVPYWWDTARLPRAERAKPLPQAVDVAILGAGYTGLSAARTLARQGAAVSILEAESAGWGASSRNGGMVLTGLKSDIALVIRKYGLNLARELMAASLAAIDCVEEIIAEEGIECDFLRCGHLLVASKPSHFQGFSEQARLLREQFGRSVQLVAKLDLSSEIGSERFHGGLVDPLSGGLNPARYVAGLIEAAERAGAQIHDHTRVERIERESRGFLVYTARGALRARAVLVATNGYTGPATPALQRRIVPIGSYIIATEPLDPELARQLSPPGRMIFDSRHYLHYFRLTPDRRLLFGGRAAFFPPTAATVLQSAAILRRNMLAIYPQLEDTKVEYAWGGNLGFAFDLLPHAGKLDGLHYALGYAGHGVAMATYLGQIMGQTLAGQAVDNPFAKLRFLTAPFGLYRGRPWFLPLAGAWYKLLDWIQ